MVDPFTSITGWLENLFLGWGLAPGFVNFLLTLVGIMILFGFLLVLDIFLVWVERKTVARFQDRLGPNRLGPYGLIQPIADVIKLLIKEDITPRGAAGFCILWRLGQLELWRLWWLVGHRIINIHCWVHLERSLK